MKALLLAAIPVLAAAQVQLYVWDPTTRVEHPVGSQYTIGSCEVRATADVLFRLRNPGPASVKLGFPDQSPGQPPFTLNGEGFALITTAQGSQTMSPGTVVEFAVRFQPVAVGGHSATLTYVTATGTPSGTPVFATNSVLMLATSLAGPTVVLDGEILASGSAIDFGSAETGTSRTRHLAIENRAGRTLSITVAVSGADFRLSGVSSLLTLDKDASAAFDILWEPQTAGTASGTLTINTVPFPLRGTATAPPLPRPQIVIDSPAPACAQQIKVRVQFAAASPAAGSGKLEVSSTRADPSLRFLSSPAFTVQKGDTAARFGSATSIDLQTGTTAAVVTITATLGVYTETAFFQLAPTVVVADSVAGLRTTISVSLVVNGYDNTRTAGPLAFTFRDRSGAILGGDTIHVDAGSAFKEYFEKADAGGIFTLRVAFPVSGAISMIDSVDISLGNSAGTLQRNVKIAE